MEETYRELSGLLLELIGFGQDNDVYRALAATRDFNEYRTLTRLFSSCRSMFRMPKEKESESFRGVFAIPFTTQLRRGSDDETRPPQPSEINYDEILEILKSAGFSSNGWAVKIAPKLMDMESLFCAEGALTQNFGACSYSDPFLDCSWAGDVFKDCPLDPIGIEPQVRVILGVTAGPTNFHPLLRLEESSKQGLMLTKKLMASLSRSVSSDPDVLTVPTRPQILGQALDDLVAMRNYARTDAFIAKLVEDDPYMAPDLMISSRTARDGTGFLDLSADGHQCTWEFGKKIEWSKCITPLQEMLEQSPMVDCKVVLPKAPVLH